MIARREGAASAPREPGMLYSALARRKSMAAYDQALVLALAFALGLGLVMVYSSSIAIAEASRATGHDSTYYLLRHSLFLAVAVALGCAGFQIPMRHWQTMSPYLFLFGALLLTLVLLPAIGREVNGSRRWLPLGPISVQPSELMKLLVVLYAADYTVRKAAFTASFVKGFLPMALVMLTVGALLLLEPDFGGFVVICALAIGILFLGGMNWKPFAALILALVAGFLLLIVSSPYRVERIVAFMNPWAEPYGKGYQLSHALIAFGRGEWFGVGLGASVEKLFYLPEAHTDFLLAVIAEELGFAGVVCVLGLFAWVVARAFAIGNRAALLEREFSALVAYGIGLWVAVQAIINIGVNVGVLPTKGLTLPLMSFGGSALAANCLAAAILLRVDWENRQLMRGKNT
jgi:cell division protein FtsW